MSLILAILVDYNVAALQDAQWVISYLSPYLAVLVAHAQLEDVHAFSACVFIPYVGSKLIVARVPFEFSCVRIVYSNYAFAFKVRMRRVY